MKCNFILYVRNQEMSAQFYSELLDMEPVLHVPGMTEFLLAENCVLGLMPEMGIKKLLGDAIFDPEESNGQSRAEIYLTVNDPISYLKRASHLGAKLLSPFSRRNWGDDAGYVMDPDGHVLAFAQKSY